MNQKYFALYTSMFILLVLLLQVLGLDVGGGLAEDTFEKPPGKYIFGPLIIISIVPVFLHIAGMLGSMVRSQKWGWLVLSIFVLFAATIPYYFIVYRHQSDI